MEIGEMVPQVLLPLRTGPRRRKADLEFGARQEVRDLIKALVCDVIPALPDDGISTTVDFAANKLVPPEPVEAEAEADGEHPDEADGIASPVSARDFLLLAAIDLPLGVIAAWTPRQRWDAVRWAAAEHLHASDNDVARLAKPFHVAAAQETAQPQREYSYPRRLSRFMPVDPETLSAAGDGASDATAVIADAIANGTPVIVTGEPQCPRNFTATGSDHTCTCTEDAGHDGAHVCPDCGAWELLSERSQTAAGAPSQPVVSLLPSCPQSHPHTSAPCVRLEGHKPPHRDRHENEWGGEPHPARDGETPCEAYHDGDSDGWLCGAQKYHGGDGHVAYDASGAVTHRWPAGDESAPAGFR